MRGNYSINRPENDGNSAECDQNLFSSGDAHNEFVGQILAKSHQRFVRKHTETDRQIRGLEMAGIQRSVTKS